MSNFNLLAAVKDIILQSQPPSKPVSQRPQAQLRKAACTHIHLTRLYGNHMCSHCGRVPRAGWVYSCTQDADHRRHEAVDAKGSAGPNDASQASPEAHVSPVSEAEPAGTNNGAESACPSITNCHLKSDSADSPLRPASAVGPIAAGSTGTVSSSSSSGSSSGDQTKLKSWVEEAIGQGHYTPVQVEILRAQRRKVLECIRKDKEAAAQACAPRPVTPANPLSNPMALDQLGWMSSHDQENKTRCIPECQYKTCSVCRPNSRDRAWECCDHAFEMEVCTIDFDNDNRPTSHVSMLRQIGLRVFKRRCKAFDESPQSTSGTSLPDSDLKVPLPKRPSLRERRGYSHRRISLRDSFKGTASHPRRALDDFMRDFRGSKVPDTATPVAGGGSGAPLEKDVTDAGDENRNLDGLCMHPPRDFALLPPKKEGAGGVGEEVKVPDGVAVTEEAVDLGAADIIMQA